MTRLVGVTKSKEIGYSGRMVKADEALAIGLVSAVHPDADVLDRALDLAEQYAGAAAAISNVKRAIMDGLNADDMADAIQIERFGRTSNSCSQPELPEIPVWNHAECVHRQEFGQTFRWICMGF